MDNYFLVLLVVLIGFSACQSDPEKKVVNNKPLSSKVEKPQTAAIDNPVVTMEESADVNTAIKETTSEKLETPKKEVEKVIEKEKVVEKPRSSNTSKPKKPAKKEEKLSAKLVTNSKTASNKKKEKKGPLPELIFDYTSYDFGIVDHGDTVSHKFYFVNNGDAPAIISEASSSCGCTVPDYPKKPIKPGQRAYVKAVFATKGKLNTQKKSITIKANTEPNYTTLYLTGEVYNRPKKKEPIDSTKLDSIKKAVKKAERDSLKLIKKAEKNKNALKNKAKNKKEEQNQKEKVKEKSTDENKVLEVENKEEEEIDYFLPTPKPKKVAKEDKKEKP